MEDQISRQDYDALKGRVDELAARVLPTQAKPQPQSVEQSDSGGRYWICRAMAASDGTFSSGTDWGAQFEQNVTYVDFGIPTLFGEINCLHPDTSHGRAALCVLKWNSPIRRTVNYHLGADNFGRVQIILNSEFISAGANEKTGDTDSTLDVREGENVLRIMTNGNVDRMEFQAGLF